MFFLWWEKCITETLVTREAFVKKRLRLTMKYLSAEKKTQKRWASRDSNPDCSLR